MSIVKQVQEILEYKEMIKSLVRKELRTRYKGSVLGFLWTFINPLLQLLVYSFMFPYLMRNTQENFTIFLFVALLPWNMFVGSIQGGCPVILFNASLVTKVYFPRVILPITRVLSDMMNLIFSYTVVIPMLLLFKVPLTFNLMWFPVILVIQTVMCAGFCMIVSSVNVYFRDIEYIVGILMMALYFMIPVMYDPSMLPSNISSLLSLNPMVGIVLAYRNIAYYGTGPNWAQLGYSTLMAVLIFVVGYMVFQKMQRGFAEEI